MNLTADGKEGVGMLALGFCHTLKGVKFSFADIKSTFHLASSKFWPWHCYNSNFFIGLRRIQQKGAPVSEYKEPKE